MVVDIDDKDLSRSKSIHLQDLDLVKVFNIVGKQENMSSFRAM